LVQATVVNRQLKVFGLAENAEVNVARIKIATTNGASGQDVASIMRLQNRAKFLKSALESGEKGQGLVRAVGGERIGRVSISYTNAEKQAMQDELDVIEAQLANQ
jgi:hypothetical protein